MIVVITAVHPRVLVVVPMMIMVVVAFVRCRDDAARTQRGEAQ